MQMQDVDSWSPPSDWSHCLQPDGDFFSSIDGALFSERTRVIHYPFSHPNINNSRYTATRERTRLEAAGVRAAAPGPTRRPAPPAAPDHSTNSCFFFFSLSLHATFLHVCVFRRESGKAGVSGASALLVLLVLCCRRCLFFCLNLAAT